jgi:tRNA 2-thiouridine synthesizing protein A
VTFDQDDTWDAGDMGCGELVLKLRARLRAMPGKTLKVIALDPGAPADLPAFCRMTGDALVAQEATTHSYWIKARDRGPPA